MTFGEMALLDHSARSATVRADTNIDALVLSAANFAQLVITAPAIHGQVLANIARSMASRMRKRNAEVLTSHL